MTLPFHPLLLALYPILALLASNIDQVQAAAALRPALIAVGAALLLVGVFRLILRDQHRAAAVASLALLAFFTYGHVYDLLKNVEWLGATLGRHRYLVPAWGAVLALGFWLILRVRHGAGLTRTLNVVGIVLVIQPLLQMALFQVQLARGEAAARGEREALVGQAPQPAPDIYYILLDAYTRDDVLRARFGVDNSGFLDGLRRLGFQVAECAQSNYAQTELTLAAALNLDYLDALGDFPAASHDRTPLLFLIRESAARDFLESLGYRTYAFETGYAFSELSDADVYLRPPRAGLRFPLTALEEILLESTALTILADARTALPPALGGALEGPLDVHRDRILYDLETLPSLVDEPGPKFVFAHIVAPHRPYLFSPDPSSDAAQDSLIPEFPTGEADGYVMGYRNQVLYLNDRMLPILERLIEQSDVPPVIILHGDHGPDDAVGAERMAILNAAYLPGVPGAVPTEMSPVNNLRLVLREVFGVDLPNLRNESFHSTYDAPFDFEEVAQACDLE